MARWSIDFDAEGNEIRYTANTVFGGKTLKYQDYDKVLYVALPSPTTWAMLHDMAIDLISVAEDRHHVFIEGFELDPDGQTVWIVTGS